VIRVIVIDNDRLASAAAVCAEQGNSSRWPIDYIVEPRSGIPYARNAGVAKAIEDGAALIAFIDDDEQPDADWLDELLHIMDQEGADVVTGPVLPVFEGRPPRWVVEGRFFERPRHRSGTRVVRAATGNVIMKSKIFQEGMAWFDETKALSGGTDTELFLRVSKAGYRIVWADRAIVYEWTPLARARAAWLIRRAFRVSSNWSACERRLDPRMSVGAVRCAKAGARIVVGLFLSAASLVGGRCLLVRSLQNVAMGCGYIAGMLGYELEEYRERHKA